jgi:2-polyprenyl-3-methyl-5-hydroxy-6-metoxy-1,4-benzoquinol methylase
MSNGLYDFSTLMDYSVWQPLVVKNLTAYECGRLATCIYHLRHINSSPSAFRNERIILDLGCRSGHIDKIIRDFFPTASIIGVDLDLQSLKLAMHSIHHAVVADIRKIPLGDSIADLAVCLEVIEHIPETDVPATLKKMGKLIKADGHLLLSTPNRDSPTYIFEKILHMVVGRQYKGGDPTHTIVYNRKKITELLQANDFKVLNNVGYWILPLTFYWVTLDDSESIMFKWFRKVLVYTIRLTNPVLERAPWLGFIQIFLCANSKDRHLSTKKVPT